MYSIEISKKAAVILEKLIKEENNLNLKLRISIKGGGCSGFKYNFSLDDKFKSTDFIFNKFNIKIIIDQLSVNYLNHSSIDYIEDIDGSYFTIINTKFKNTCGCGKSFTI